MYLTKINNMNFPILFSAIIALAAVIGHFAIGKKNYLNPVLESNLDAIPKKVMLSLFHYMSVFMVFSTIILFAGASKLCPLYDYVHHMIRFIALCYGGFAIVQFLIAIISEIKGGVFKLFQWVFWLLISVLGIFGTM